MFSLSQGIVTDWQRSVGGYEADGGNLDGSFITSGSNKSVVVICSSESNVGGDKTAAPCYNINHEKDYWIFKLDSLGNKIWDYKYGSLLDDTGNGIIHTADNGYLLAGLTLGDGCDKSQAGSTPSFWIVKTDSLGIMQWNKRYTGPGGTVGYNAYQSADGGYYLVGISSSGIGMQVTDTCHGGTDVWLVRIAANGTKLWDRMLGSDGAEVLSGTTLYDNSIVLAGATNANSANGDVTMASYGPSSTFDAWLIKVDVNGATVWDKRYGSFKNESFASIVTDSIGNLYAAGAVSDSSAYPDVTDTLVRGMGDVWLVKCDSMGNKIWDKRFGGKSNDGANHIIYSQTNKLLMACGSWSDAGYEKSENNFGGCDFWVVCTDTSGNLLWDKSYGGNTIGQEYFCDIADVGDDHYVLSGKSGSPISGNKIVAPWDTTTGMFANHLDMWVIAFHYDSHETGLATQPYFKATIFPNPVQDNLNISLPFDVQNMAVEIIDITGRVVLKYNKENVRGNMQVPVANLSSGLYQLLLTTGDQRSGTKFIKQ